MAIVRAARKQRYTNVDNQVIEDGRLSFKALGVLVYLLSKPDNWCVSMKQVAQSHDCGVSSVESALKELIRAGYATRVRNRRDDGTFEWDWEVSDQPRVGRMPRSAPVTENHPTGDHPTGDPVTGFSPPLVSTEEPSTEDQSPLTPPAQLSLVSTNEESEFEEFWRAYPRRVKKASAMKAWKAARKKTDHSTLIERAKAYARETRDRETRYIAHPSTWLNQEYWADNEPERESIPVGPNGKPLPPGAVMDEFGNIWLPTSTPRSPGLAPESPSPGFRPDPRLMGAGLGARGN